MYGERFRGGGSAPVNIGDELDVKIEAVGEKGDGIAKKDGFVLFVPGVKEGDEVRIRVTKVLRKVGFAEVVGKAEGKVETETKPEATEETAATEEPVEELEEAGEEVSKEPAEDTEDFGEEEVKKKK